MSAGKVDGSAEAYGLPPLPSPVATCEVYDDEYGRRFLEAQGNYFTADQMIAYGETVRATFAELTEAATEAHEAAERGGFVQQRLMDALAGIGGGK